ncbi:unnamed protein product, partial [Musa acuminata subsp. burmannicoides]
CKSPPLCLQSRCRQTQSQYCGTEKKKKERKREREREREHGMHGQEKSEWDMELRAWCSVIAMDVPAKEQGGAAAQDVNPRPLFLHQRRAPSGESPPHLLPLGHDRYC